MSATTNCFICNMSLECGDIVNVTLKGLKTLIKCSKKRGDELWVKFEGINKCRLHKNCRALYNLGRKIPVLQNPSTNDAELASTSSTGDNFDFEEVCFLCNEELDRKHNIVTSVTSDDVQLSIEHAAKERNDEWGKKVDEFLKSNPPLMMVQAKYHGTCLSRFLKFMSSPVQGSGIGRPVNNDLEKAFIDACNYIDNNSNSLFTLSEIINELEVKPTTNYLLKKLKSHYKDDLNVLQKEGKPTIIWLKDATHFILLDSWYTNKAKTAKDERLRIVETAAEIIREDITSEVYDTKSYPCSDQFLDDVLKDIPDSLCFFLNKLLINKKKSVLAKSIEVKRNTLAHFILSAIRPKSFISTIQLAVSVYLHRKTGSKLIINALSRLGMCSTYHNTLLYEASSILDPKTEIDKNAFIQLVYDNADHNVCTLDGLNTLHCMGGCSCITPKTAVSSRGRVKKLEKMPSAEELAKKADVHIIPYGTSNISGLQKIIFKNVLNVHENSNFPASYAAYLMGKALQLKDLPMWRGYMEFLTNKMNYQVSRVLCLPFVNLPPSNIDTINTVLHAAVDECKKNNQKTCFVTFDQPLYAKAREIVGVLGQNELKCVVVRLGGFHMLMSYLGAIGYIMEGSGVEDLWKTIYAGNSVEKMLSGHAYSRAVRAHLLTYVALGEIVIESSDNINDKDRQYITSLFADLTNNPPTLEAVNNDYRLQAIADTITRTLANLKNNGPTAQLWVQYFNCVTTIKKFIEADRLGNWELHLQTIQEMLPLFHATGRLAYAKYAQIYLQDMQNLINIMDPDEYWKFTHEGFFTIRRSDKKWAGMPTDLTIEQVVMRLMKSSGGLTHGRGVSPSVLATFILGLPHACDIMEQFEDFCDVRGETSEQHTDTRMGRKNRDNNDISKLTEWLRGHNPFPETDKIISIGTGICGDEAINCYDAINIGLNGVAAMTGKDAASIKMERTNRVKSLTFAKRGVKIHGEIVSVDTTLLFQRIMTIIKGDDTQLKNAFAFELAPYPLALFDETGSIRKTAKSNLYKSFRPIRLELISHINNWHNIIDGGFLLHKVIWPLGITYKQIFIIFEKYIRRNYGSSVVVVFDGYNEVNTSIKSYERSRRFQKNMGAEIIFTEDMIATLNATKFLSNSSNKRRFIEYLSRHLHSAGIATKQAIEDADRLIVVTAIEESAIHDHVAVVGNDIDLLVLITALTPEHKTIYFRKPNRGNKLDDIYRSTDFIEFKNIILLAHAFTGCDTTNALFLKGKNTILKAITKRSKLNEQALVFTKSFSTSAEVIAAGTTLMLAAYGADASETSLNEYRWKRFKVSLSRAKTEVRLAGLPPTIPACSEHVKRVYYQVQQWMGNNLIPEDWGWKISNSMLMPVMGPDSPAPDNLLHVISCNCKSGNCEKRCGCRKAGLKCTSICTGCGGDSCSNPEVVRNTMQNDYDDSQYIQDELGCLEGESEDVNNDLSDVTPFNFYKDDELSDDDDCMV